MLSCRPGRRLQPLFIAATALAVGACTPSAPPHQSSETARPVAPVDESPAGGETPTDEPTIDSWQRRSKLTALDAFDGDRFGFAISISGDLALVSAVSDNHQGTDTGAAYVLQRDEDDPDKWTEIKKLVASDGAPGDGFGYAVAINGDVALVGAPFDDDHGMFSGAAYVFARDAGGADNWGEVTKLHNVDPANGDEFGRAVALSEGVALVAAPYDDERGSLSGSVSLHARNNGGSDNWGLLKRLTASDAGEDDAFGFSVAAHDDLAIIGGISEGEYGTDPGMAYIFARDHGGADNWGEVQKLRPSDAPAGGAFGASVDIHTDMAIVGAPMVGEDARGAAYVYRRDTTTEQPWRQVRKLSVDDSASGQSLGVSVAIEAATAVVGASGQHYFGIPSDDRSGAAYVFTSEPDNPDMWQNTATLTAPEPPASDGFAFSVAFSANTLIAGAFDASHNQEKPGAAYVFTPNHTPIGVDDHATTAPNTKLAVDVLSNDRDPDGDLLSVAAVTSPNHGTIAHTASEITYTPDADFTGTDSFRYTVSDGADATATANVTITVEASTSPDADAGLTDVGDALSPPNAQGCGCTTSGSQPTVPLSALLLLGGVALYRGLRRHY